MFDVSIAIAVTAKPGHSAFASILSCGEHRKSITNTDAVTQHQQALKAVIETINSIKKPSNVSIMINNRYIVESSSRVRNWMAHDWKLANGQQASNIELWKELIKTCKAKQVKLKFVAADATNEEFKEARKLLKGGSL